MTVSPIFRAPWVDTSIFRIDWLHCADQGVTADFLGNLLVLVSKKLHGRSIEERTGNLWQKVQHFYKENKTRDCLQNLTPGMLVQPKKPPKLRASAAQTRALVPFGLQCAVDLLDDNNPVEAAVSAAAFHLDQCYRALSHESMFGTDVLREHSTKFALQYVALSDAAEDDKVWRLKPKLHLFLEVSSEGGKPSLNWTYRDEDFGGSVARMSRRRGGLLSVPAFSANLIQRFRLQQPVLRMMSV